MTPNEQEFRASNHYQMVRLTVIITVTILRLQRGISTIDVLLLIQKLVYSVQMLQIPRIARNSTQTDRSV